MALARRPVPASDDTDPRRRRRLRVLHLVFSSNQTMGLDVVVGQLARAQVRAGIVEPVVLAASTGPDTSLLGLEGVPAIRFPSPRRGLPRYLAHIGTLLRLDPARDGFDLVHAHGQRAIYLLAALRRAGVAGWAEIPLVYSCHGWLEDTALRRLGVRLELGCYRRADAVLACSAHQVARVQEACLRTSVRYVVNGIEPPEPPDSAESGPTIRERLELPNGAELVGNVGRLSSEKRQDVFLQACRLILTRRPSTYFLVVGDGRRRGRLQALARSLGIAGHVRLTGFVEDARVMLRELALLIHTSDCEASPVVVIEAMALGVPVVATCVGGIPGLIDHGAHGLSASPGDVHALAGHALELLADPPRREAMARRARGRFERELTVELMRQRTEHLYLETVAARRPCCSS